LALYAIGDLHLSLGTNKPMDIFGGGWVNYIEKLKKGFEIIGPDDVCVLCGDTSWGMQLDESLEDMRFIENLPGRKIILKGNHDYWWNTASKMKSFFNANGIKSIDILHNNCYYHNNIAICGTRGWLTDDEFSPGQNGKIMAREAMRLEASLKSAKKEIEKICFFHYPPRLKSTINNDIISIMNSYNITRCYYGHLHGDGHRNATRGLVEGIDYEMISADYINFTPQKVEHE